MKSSDIVTLRERVAFLEHQNKQLREERDLLRRTPTLAQGLKGETLIVHLTGGIPTGYKDPHDVTVKNGDRLEVKYSHLNAPGKSKTKRWNWHSVFGAANNNQYEYLVLIGEKDLRYEDQYPASLPFVFFLVPRPDVDRIKTGTDIAINTNLATAMASRTAEAP